MGFPSPAEDFDQQSINLNDVLIRNPPATFFYRATGNGMIEAGICDGDILVVDRSVIPISGDIVIASWDSNPFVCKMLRIQRNHIQLQSCNRDIAPISLSAGTEVEILTIVGVARAMRRSVKSAE